MASFKVEMGMVIHAEGADENAARTAAINLHPHMHVIKIEPLHVAAPHIEPRHDKLKQDIHADHNPNAPVQPVKYGTAPPAVPPVVKP